MKTIFFILLFFLVLVSEVPAQIMDSIKLYLHQKPKVSFRFDSNTSFISNNGTSIWGVNLGLDFTPKFKTGIGYYFLYPQIGNKIKVYKGIVTPDTIVNSDLSFNYGGLFAEYVFYDNINWETCFTFHLGIGVSRYEYIINNKTFHTDAGIMGLYEAHISAQYRVFFWLALGGGIGYRLMLMDNNISNENFSSPIYITKVKIYFEDVYRKYFPKKEKPQ